MTFMRHQIVCSAILFLMGATAAAQQPRPALEGLDPVLLAQGKEEPGQANLSAQSGGFLYVFASPASRDQFLKDPARWGIQLGGACARMGDPVMGMPDSYYVHDGRIYIFGSPDCYKEFRKNPAKYLETPIEWKPAPEALEAGAARLAGIRAAMGLTGMTGWSEKRTLGATKRSLMAKLPFSIEADTTNPRFSFHESVGKESIVQTMGGETRRREGSAARAIRAAYARDFLWLISGSFDAVPEAGGGVNVFTGREIVTLEVREKRVAAAHWPGRAAGGEVTEVRVVFGDFRQADGGGLVPFRGDVSGGGKAEAGLSWTLESCSIVRQAGWTQWGGPGRDFQVAGAVEPWPDSGPRKLWSRKIGDGYSAIVSDGTALYTMYRDGEDEVVLAAAAATGATIWEHRYRAPMFAGFEDVQGAGPRATPAIDGGLLITVGASGLMNCLRRDSGKVVWAVDLRKTFGASVRARGYSVSPLAWKDTVIVLAGGAGSSVVCLRTKDGTVAWKARDEMISYASPFLMQVNGKPVLVALMAKEILGLNPDSGALLWSHPHANSELVNVSAPVAGPDGILVLSSAYDGGCRALQVTGDGVSELWSHRLLRIHHGNAVRIGGTIYGSSGDFGPSPLTALDARTGKVHWRDRSLGKAMILGVGDRLLALDEDGILALLEVSGAAPPRILARTVLMNGLSWTAPSLVDGKLYVRNRTEMAAFELIPASNAALIPRQSLGL